MLGHSVCKLDSQIIEPYRPNQYCLISDYFQQRKQKGIRFSKETAMKEKAYLYWNNVIKLKIRMKLVYSLELYFKKMLCAVKR